MATFIYTVKPDPTRTLKGQIEAESRQEAVNKLSKMGYYPVCVEPSELVIPKKGFGLWKISRRDIVLFTRQLATLLESGVNILDAFRIICDQIPNKYLKAVLIDVNARIKDGKSISEGMGGHQQVFGRLYTAMVRSGEASGTVDKSLKRLADFLEKEEEFRNTVRSALTYPAFVFAVSVLTIGILLGFVIPRLTSMFEDMGQALPLPTKLLIGISDGLRAYWWVIAALIFAVIMAVKRVGSTPQGRLAVDSIKLRLPLLGEITRKTQIGRLMRTMSLLLSSGIPIVQAMEISSSIMDNQVLSKEVDIFREKISGGSKFSQCLKDSALFASFVISIVTVGEESGRLDSSLLRIADDYEQDVDRRLKTLTRLLEPIVILVMGLIVGFIVLSMLLPIFQINLIAR